MAEKEAEIVLNMDATREVIKEIIDSKYVPAMKQVADACNAGLTLDPGQKGYMVSTEGDKPLTKHDYRATCITAGAEAIIDNAAHNTLIKNFHLVGGT